jgi:hypothetical protein
MCFPYRIHGITPDLIFLTEIGINAKCKLWNSLLRTYCFQRSNNILSISFPNTFPSIFVSWSRRFSILKLNEKAKLNTKRK